MEATAPLITRTAVTSEPTPSTGAAQTRSSREQATLELRRRTARALALPASSLLDCAGMEPAVHLARRLAASPGAPVLLQGERGSGLPELARLIHETDPLLKRGSYRMVHARAVGRPTMNRLRAGTFYLEDLEELTPMGQEWLVETLTEAAANGGRSRIIAASRLSVPALVQQAGLGQELILMLDVARITVSPLRARRYDVLPLARRFLAHYARTYGRLRLRFSADAERRLEEHAYPGNARELRNVVERAVALEATDEIQAAAIVFHDDFFAPADSPEAALSTARKFFTAYERREAKLPSLSELEREYMLMLVRELRGRRTDISRVMGVSYPTVLKKLALHGLDVRAILTDADE